MKLLNRIRVGKRLSNGDQLQLCEKLNDLKKPTNKIGSSTTSVLFKDFQIQYEYKSEYK